MEAAGDVGGWSVGTWRGRWNFGPLSGADACLPRSGTWDVTTRSVVTRFGGCGVATALVDPAPTPRPWDATALVDPAPTPPGPPRRRPLLTSPSEGEESLQGGERRFCLTLCRWRDLAFVQSLPVLATESVGFRSFMTSRTAVSSSRSRPARLSSGVFST
jgi:hypothetical protein